MNNDFELENMRQQMDVLKKKLQKEEIINEQLMRSAIGTKLRRIRFDRWRKMFIIVLALVYVPWMLYDLVCAPLWFIVATIAFLAIAGFYDIYTTWSFSDSDLSDMRLLELQQKMVSIKRNNARWLWIGIPFIIVWTGCFLWLIIADQDSAIAYGGTTPIIIGTLIGAVIGGLIGMKIHLRNQRNYQEIIDQIEDLTAEN